MRHDAELLASELLRALRGERSQVAFSRRLGYRSNVAYTWESGQRFPAVEAFFHAIRRTGGDPEAALARFAAGPAATSKGLGVFLDSLRGTSTVSAVARRMGRSRTAVARWLAGEASPRLPDLLRLVDALTDRVLDFVAVFADPGLLPSVAADWARLEASRAMARGSPWATAVLLALELDDYAGLPEHVDGWLAARLAIPVEVEVECLALLQRAGQIRWRRNRWAPVAVVTLDTRMPGEPKTGSLRSFWAGVAKERLDADAPGLRAWNLGVVSVPDVERIQEVQRRAFREIRSIVAESAPAERMLLLSWALVAIGPASG